MPLHRLRFFLIFALLMTIESFALGKNSKQKKAQRKNNLDRKTT